MPNGPKGTNRRPYMVLKKYYDYVTPPRTSLPAGSAVRLRFKNQARTTAGVTVPHAYGEPQPYETRRHRPTCLPPEPAASGMKKPEYGHSVPRSFTTMRAVPPSLLLPI